MNSIFKFLTLVLLIASVNAQAQIGINNPTPDPSAALDVTSTTQGMLVPRMTQAQRTAIASPATGLLVYQTDTTAGFYFYNGTTWSSLNGATGATGPQGSQGPTGLAGPQGPAGIGYGGTSNSAKTISLGSKTFSVQSGLAYIAGERIRFVDQANPLNFLEGIITSYTGSSLVANIDNTGGSGTIPSWNLSVGSNLGVAGANGQGVPTGGTTGQVLTKIDATDYNTQWTTPGAGSGAQVVLRATKTTDAQVLPLANGTNTGTLVTFNNVISNNTTLGTYSTSTNTLTVNQTGLYMVQAVTRTLDNASPSQTVGHTLWVDIDNAGIANVNTIHAIYPAATGINFPAGVKGKGFVNVLLYLNTGQTINIKGLGANSSTAPQAATTDGSCQLIVVKL